MAPIPIAVIGLSQSAKTSWASQAHVPYLLSDRGRSRYEIVALLNSSKEAAEKAIKAYDLPGNVKAYGSPKDLAGDPDVELVVCTTRVDVHYDSVRPSIEAGKNVFAEWPLAENVGRARELADLAKKSGSKTLVGLQSRVAPPVVKVKEILQSGAIGKVVSSDVQAYTPRGGGNEISEGLGYFLEKRVGGNPVTIAFAHTIDFIHSVLGEFRTSHAQTQIQRPNQQVINRETESSRPAVSDVPDLVSVHGTLHSSPTVTENASLTVHFATGPPFPGTTPFVWTITGTAGRLRLSSERGPFIGSEAAEYPIAIEVEDSATGEVRRVEWEWEDWQVSLPGRGRSVARVYDLWAAGGGGGGLCDFEGAVARHAQVDGILW